MRRSPSQTFLCCFFSQVAVWVKYTWAVLTGEPHYKRHLEIKSRLTVPLLTACRQPYPERIVWPEKTHQWGNLLIFFLPMFSPPELFVSFLPLFYLQAVESIETLPTRLFPALWKHIFQPLKHTGRSTSFLQWFKSFEFKWLTSVIVQEGCCIDWWNAAGLNWTLNMYICWALFWAVMKLNNISWILTFAAVSS